MKALLKYLLCFCGVVSSALASDVILPDLFGSPRDHLVYFHSHTVYSKQLEEACSLHPIFEIDLAWAHAAFHPSIINGKPYIGHPEEFYTKLGKPFPVANVSLEEFQDFLKNNPAVKVLIDIKDEATFPYLKEFVKAVGAERCIVHAFIKDWTLVPSEIPVDPHWYREDIDLEALDKLLTSLGIPLVANCRGFSDEHVEANHLISKMGEDAKKYKSIVCLGLYYPGAPLPKTALLESINEAGYYAWINGNVEGYREKIGHVKHIAMSDEMSQCTPF